MVAGGLERRTVSPLPLRATPESKSVQDRAGLRKLQIVARHSAAVIVYFVRSTKGSSPFLQRRKDLFAIQNDRVRRQVSHLFSQLRDKQGMDETKRWGSRRGEGKSFSFQ